jgi:hypothetical protein
MHPPVGPAWLVWLETSRLAAEMRQSLWLYPIVEIVHILGLAILVGWARRASRSSSRRGC